MSEPSVFRLRKTYIQSDSTGAVRGVAASTDVFHLLQGVAVLHGHSEHAGFQSMCRRGAIGLPLGQQAEDELELAKTLRRLLEQPSGDACTRQGLSLELLEQSIPFRGDESLHSGGVDCRRS